MAELFARAEQHVATVLADLRHETVRNEIKEAMSARLAKAVERRDARLRPKGRRVWSVPEGFGTHLGHRFLDALKGVRSVSLHERDVLWALNPEQRNSFTLYAKSIMNDPEVIEQAQLLKRIKSLPKGAEERSAYDHSLGKGLENYLLVEDMVLRLQGKEHSVSQKNLFFKHDELQDPDIRKVAAIVVAQKRIIESLGRKKVIGKPVEARGTKYPVGLAHFFKLRRMARQ